MGKDNPPSATQSPKTPEDKNSPNHDFMIHDRPQIPQIHFEGSQCYTKFPERDPLKIKRELPKYYGKDHKGAIIWVNKMDAIFGANPPIGEQEKVMTASNYLEAEAYDWFLWWSTKCATRSFN